MIMMMIRGSVCFGTTCGCPSFPVLGSPSRSSSVPFSRCMLAAVASSSYRRVRLKARTARARTHSTSRTMATSSPYQQLRDELAEIDALSGIEGLLQWDEQVMMPSGDGAASARAKASSALAGVVHAKRTASSLGELIELCGGGKATQEKLGADATTFDVANVKRAAEGFDRASRVPPAMAKKEAELGSRGYRAWMEAKKNSDYSVFAPVLKEWVELVKERSSLINPGGDPYDTALDDYERGLTSARLDEIFAPVKAEVSALIKQVYDVEEGPVALRSIGGKSVLTGDFDAEKQAALSRQIALDMGFDLTAGRLDVSAHPFTGGADFTDVRMTTRYKSDDLSEGLTGTIHETGHALYEQGRPREYAGQPVSQAHSMGVHESQSLLWERMVALSPDFSTFLLPKLSGAFYGQFDGVTNDQLHASFNTVKKPRFIRVESDELTYPMHVILRYELEQGLIKGDVDVDALPELWNAKMEELLGHRPPDDAKGVLQDVHWSAGAIGYFPTYLLGAMYACQIYGTALTKLPGLQDEIRKGEFARLREWLNKNVHALGSSFDSADALLEHVTGKPLDGEAFVKYLREKYTKLYGL